MDEEYAGNTIKVLISHLKNYLKEKGTKFKQEEWKVLYNSTNKLMEKLDLTPKKRKLEEIGN
jgi:predicted SprT family Zn-dependent metalloprotease